MTLTIPARIVMGFLAAVVGFLYVTPGYQPLGIAMTSLILGVMCLLYARHRWRTRTADDHLKSLLIIAVFVVLGAVHMWQAFREFTASFNAA